VREFQRAFKLVPDGLVGRNTWAALYRVYWGIIDGVQLPPTVGAAPGIPTFPGTSVAVGASGENVRRIQECLNNLTNRYPSIPKLNADGAFGPLTQASVIAFQRVLGLAADGIVGPITWNRLFTECESVGTVPPETLPPFPGTLLRVGSRGDDVRRVQQCINNAANRFPSIPRLTADGIFGPLTQASVIAFQRAFSLSPDGVVGPITWNRLMQECGTQAESVETFAEEGDNHDCGCGGNPFRLGLSDELYADASYAKGHKLNIPLEKPPVASKKVNVNDNDFMRYMAMYMILRR
jgi:peptidoglycan hydrolase-like protein with peptidoglycan-binding domain